MEVTVKFLINQHSLDVFRVFMHSEKGKNFSSSDQQVIKAVQEFFDTKYNSGKEPLTLHNLLSLEEGDYSEIGSILDKQED